MRLLSAVRPTTNQKRVIAKIAAAATPTVAGEEISSDSNMIAARNMLMKLGIITFADKEAALTDRGQQIAAEENIVDQGGQLTPTGEQLAYTNSRNEPDGDQAGGAPQGQPPAPGGEMDLEMPTESLSLLRQLLR